MYFNTHADMLPLKMHESQLLTADDERVSRWLKNTTHLRFMLNQAQKLGNIGSWYLDRTSGGIWWSDEMYKIHELDRSFDSDNYLGTLLLFEAALREALVKATHLLFDQHVPFDITGTVTTRAGNKKWLRIVGYPEVENETVTGIMGLTFDITEVKQLEEMLHTSEAIFSTAFRANPDSMAIVREEDMIIIDVNQKLTRLLGYTREELIGRYAPGLGLFIRKEDREMFYNRYFNEGHSQIESVWKKKNGDVVHVLITGTRIVMKEKYYLLFFIRDNTALALAREAVRPGAPNQDERIRENSFVRKLDRLIRHLELQHDDPVSKLALPSTEGFTFIRPRDIIYGEAQSNYTAFYLIDGKKYTVSKTLKEFENMLPDEFFIRIHNSYIVNVNYIRKYNKGEGTVLMENDALLDVAKRKKDLFHRRIGVTRYSKSKEVHVDQ